MASLPHTTGWGIFAEGRNAGLFMGSPTHQHFILLQLCSLTGLMEGRGQAFCEGSGPFCCLLCFMGFSPKFRVPRYVPDPEVENKFYCRVVEASLPQWFSAPQLPHYLFFFNWRIIVL